MKKRFLAIILVLCVLLSVSGCKQDSSAKPTTEPATELPTEPPAPDVQELFSEAVEKLLASDTVTMKIDASEEHTVWGEKFVKQLESEMILEGLQDELLCKVETSLEYNDDAEFEMTEFYIDGYCYATFEDAKYRQEIDAEEYLAKQYPVCLFDSASFAEITAQETENGTLLTFTEATALEVWVAPEYAVLTSAQATALLGENGIKEMSYG